MADIWVIIMWFAGICLLGVIVLAVVVSDLREKQRLFDAIKKYRRIYFVDAKRDQKIEPNRYPMCKDQPAQIDCRKDWCLFWRNGKCKNISPAITLNQDGTYNCWSYDDNDCG